MPSGELALSSISTSASQETRWSVDELIPFGKYILLNKISAGATAAVYRAKIRGEAGFERLVTIKRILPQMAGDPDFVETFVHEAKVCARLTHSNICPIYELGKVGESLYMASEWVAGKDLRAILQRLQATDRVMPPLAAAWIASRLCDALDYAHGLKDIKGERLNLLHQDLSPANVMVSYDGAVKLLDFGLARAAGRAQQTNVDALKQKLGYMSPELVLGTAIDRRSDLFGVGVCLYEMVTGKRLFSGSDDIATLKLLRNATVQPPSALRDDTPDELETIIMRSLARDPEQRWPSAGEMAHALTAFVVSDDPSFGTRNLVELMQSLFETDRQSEQVKLNTLLKASQDGNLMEQRRRFFHSPMGAGAIARAEATRKHASARPPPLAPPAPAAGITSASQKSSTESLTGSHISERKARAPLPAPASTANAQQIQDDALTTYRAPAPQSVSMSKPAMETPFPPAPPALETPRPGAFARGALATSEAGYNDLIRRSGEDEAEPTMYRPEPSVRSAVAAQSGEPRASNEHSDAGRITQPSIDPGFQELQNEPTVFELAPDEYSEPLSAEADKPAVQPAATAARGADAATAAPPATAANVAAKPSDPAAADFDSEATSYLIPGQPSAARALFEPAATPQTYDDEATHIFFSADGSEIGLPDVPDDSLTTVSPPTPLRVPLPAAAPAAVSGKLTPPRPSGRQPTGGHAPVPFALASPTNKLTATEPTQPRLSNRAPTLVLSSLPPAARTSLYWVLGVALAVLLTGLILKTPLGITLGLRKPPIGVVIVSTTPVVPATIKLDGIYRGRAPTTLDGIPAGSRVLAITADGYEPVTRTITVEGGETRTESITLLPTTPAPLAQP
jgi:serine/threonine protein kinase